MTTSFTDIFAKFTTALQSVTAWSETTINDFFQGLNTEIQYVTAFVVNELPVLIKDGTAVVAGGLAIGKLVPGALGAEITAAATALSAAVTFLENIVSGITQAGQQQTAAESLVSHPDPAAALRQARLAQADVDIKKAKLAALIAKAGQ